MMLLADDGTSYCENHFTVKNGKIINNFTGKDLGVFIRKIPSTNYLWLCENENYDRTNYIDKDAKGDLIETMKGLNNV